MKESLQLKLKSILKSLVTFDAEIIEIDENTSLEKDLLFDSIIFMDLVLKLEQEFELSLDVAVLDAAEFQTAGTLRQYIQKLILKKDGRI
ncbi:MAG: acyl carrier protein [bacterium]|nr:acyl carrier protein [bacterium]